MNDPTNDVIRDLDNPLKYFRVEGVPVCLPHRRVFKNADGSETVIEVKDDDLPKIAADANRADKSGRLQPFTLGHRMHGQVDETKQPPLLGFHRHFRVARYMRDWKWVRAVVADEYCANDLKTEFNVYRKYPYRSMEITPSKTIVGVAALLQPPALDMGTVLVYSSDISGAAKTHLYTMEPISMNPDAMPTVDDNDPEFQKFMQYFSAAMKKYGGAMGATNANMPAMTDNPQGYSANDPIHAKVIELEKQVKIAQDRETDANCRRLLDPIKDYSKFDYGYELGLMKTLPNDEARAARVEYIMNYHQALPTGKMIPVAYSAKPQGMPSPVSTIDPMTITPEQHAKVKKYAADNGVTYAVALENALK